MEFPFSDFEVFSKLCGLLFCRGLGQGVLKAVYDRYGAKEALPAGFYLVRISDGVNTLEQKVLKE